MVKPTGRSWQKKAALVCLLVATLSLWAPPAMTQTAPEQAKTGTDLESWYYVADDSAEEPPAPLPIVPDPVNPYGENTLHVGIVGGQEDSRMYITLDLEQLPITFEIVEGKLILPIAEDAATVGADGSHAEVCLAMPPAKAQQGSFEEPPEVDCKTKSPAPYREKPFPHLSADLKPFEEDLTFSALAIVPSERAVTKQETWHVAFYGKKNETEGAKPIRAEISYIETDFGTPVAAVAPPPSTDSAPATDFSSDFASNVGGFDSGPSFDVDPGPAAAPEPAQADAPAPVEVAAEQPALEPASATRPGYNVVWVVPLVLLAMYFYFGSALTKEIVTRRSS